MRSVLLCLALCLAPSAHASSSNNPDATGGGSNSKEDAFSVESEAEAEARSVGDAVAQADSAASLAWDRSGGASPAALTKAELCRTASSEATANNLPTRFFTNLIQQESGFRPDVVSPAGAQGIAQFMPPVASSYGLANPFEPVAALKASANLLADLVAQFGNLGLAAAAYNAGPKRVQDWIDKRRNLPAETRQYVRKITGRTAEHWVNRRMDLNEGSLPTYSDCPDLPPVMAMRANQISSAGVIRNTGPAAKRNVVSQRPSSARARLGTPGSTISRFAAMPTPVIMADEKVQSRQRASPEKRRPEGSLPRPSEFIVGARVPAAIKASESAVLAGKTRARWAKGKNRTRVADATPRATSSRQRKT